jgi:hypothetical protein
MKTPSYFLIFLLLMGMAGIGNAATYDGIILTGEDVSTNVTITSVYPTITPAPINTLFLSGEDIYDQISLAELAPAATPAPINTLFLSGEDTYDQIPLAELAPTATPVPIEILFISGEDAMITIHEPPLQEPFNGSELCLYPCDAICGPDFNGNGYPDWGDVVKLAYYVWNLIESPC